VLSRTEGSRQNTAVFMNVLYKVGETGTFLIARISGLNKKKYYGVELKIPKFF